MQIFWNKSKNMYYKNEYISITRKKKSLDYYGTQIILSLTDQYCLITSEYSHVCLSASVIFCTIFNS